MAPVIANVAFYWTDSILSESSSLKADLNHMVTHLQCVVANKPSNEIIFENCIIK